jgi:methyltransferase (TIGR00027 family)
MGDSTTNRSMFPLFGMHSAPGSEPRSPQATDSQIDAAVILGAGFDTRAYRLPVLAATPVYEIDLPANIDRKRTRLTKLFGGIPANVTLVPIDVETQDLADVSANHGYRPERPTFFVWEAVTQYLTEAGVRKTFDFLATAAPGSHLVFTYVAQWPRVASVGDRTFSLRQKDLSANSPSPALRGRTDYRHRC